MDARKLRHWIIIQQPVNEQDSTGAVEPDWQNFAECWAGIEHLSAREFVASAAEQSKVIARITIRYRPDINATMRIYHPAHDEYFDIHGVLRDNKSGNEYITLPVSEGIRTYGSNVPENAVTYNGDLVTYLGEIVTYTE